MTEAAVMPEEFVTAKSFDQMRDHLTEQLAHISTETSIRNEALKDYTDEGFNALRRSLDQFRSEFHDYIAALHAEIDRRFQEAKEEVKLARETQTATMDAAMVSAEKAVDKANQANEKRFEGVNEFRGQLTDQAATFLTRNEYLSGHQSLTEKLDSLDKRTADRLSTLELRLTSRLDLGDGRDSGTLTGRDQQRLNVAQIIAVLAVLAAITTTILLALKK